MAIIRLLIAIFERRVDGACLRAGLVHLRRYLPMGQGCGTGRGFALLVVMIVILVLSVIFAAVLRINRSSLDDASMRLAQLKVSAAVDGAMLSAIYDLSRADLELEFNKANIISIGEYTVSVKIRPELSKFDVNYATADSLSKLLEAAGIPSDRAAALAREIVAWRSAPQGDWVPPKNSGQPARPFQTIADLSHVRGGGPDLSVCMEPDVTVFTHTQSVDSNYASDRLYRAIYGTSPDKERRNSFDSVVGGNAARPDLFEVSAETRDASNGITVRRLAVVRIVAGGQEPFRVLSRSYWGVDERDVEDACRRLANHVI